MTVSWNPQMDFVGRLVLRVLARQIFIRARDWQRLAIAHIKLGLVPQKI